MKRPTGSWSLLSFLASMVLTVRSRLGGVAGRWITALLLTAGLGFLVVLAYGYRSEVVSWVISANPWMLAGSLLALLVSNVGAALVFGASLPRTSDTARWPWTVEGVMLASQLGKYIPGKAWGAVIQKLALGGEASIAGVLIANLDLAILSVAVSVMAASVFIVSTQSGGALIALALILGVAVSILVARYQLAGRVALWLGTRFAGLQQQSGNSDRKRSIAHVFGASLFFIGFVLGWLGVAQSSPQVGSQDAYQLAAILCASYVVGLLSLLPAGLGARELSVVLIARWLGYDDALAASLAVVSRIAMVVLDLTCAAVGAAILCAHRRKSQC